MPTFPPHLEQMISHLVIRSMLFPQLNFVVNSWALFTKLVLITWFSLVLDQYLHISFIFKDGIHQNNTKIEVCLGHKNELLIIPNYFNDSR